MRSFGIGLLVALMATSWAKADELEDSGLWISPKYELLKAKWPHDAAGGLIYGKVYLDCGVGVGGFAADCKVKGSNPANPALERAALDLAPLFRMWNSEIVRATLEVDVQYDEPPDLLKKPSHDQLMAVYPSEARKRGAGGYVTVKCIVQTTGIGRACSVTGQDHPELGFGPAALVLAQTFLFKPAIRHGQPVEADLSLAVNFQVGPAPRIPLDTPRTTRVLTGATWSKAPTVSEILGEIDKKVGDKFAEGKVVLQCQLNKRTGKLGGCKVASTSPGMAQFTGVANTLIPKFRADPAELARIKEDVAINLAFAFPDMSAPEWNKRYLAHPDWIQTFDPDSKISIFPEAAAKAGLKTGTATVDCVVAPNGALTHCEAVRESTPNVGFGETAIRIAETFVANPWNEDGLPVDGAHVRMPIQMDYAPPADAPAPAAAAKP